MLVLTLTIPNKAVGSQKLNHQVIFECFLYFLGVVSGVSKLYFALSLKFLIAFKPDLRPVSLQLSHKKVLAQPIIDFEPSADIRAKLLQNHIK